MSKLTLKLLQEVVDKKQAYISLLEKEKSDLKERLIIMEDDLRSALGKPNNKPYRESYDISSWSELISCVAKLRGEVTKEGEIRRYLDIALANENAKLWHMMRIAMKDETLKEVPKNIATRIPIIPTNPDWTN